MSYYFQSSPEYIAAMHDERVRQLRQHGRLRRLRAANREARRAH
jgi:hypothetical protein